MKEFANELNFSYQLNDENWVALDKNQRQQMGDEITIIEHLINQKLSKEIKIEYLGRLMYERLENFFIHQNDYYNNNGEILMRAKLNFANSQCFKMLFKDKNNQIMWIYNLQLNSDKLVGTIVISGDDYETNEAILDFMLSSWRYD